MKAMYMDFEVSNNTEVFTHFKNFYSFTWNRNTLESENLNELIGAIRLIFKKTGILPVLNLNMDINVWEKIQREIFNLNHFSVMIGKKRLMPFELN